MSWIDFLPFVIVIGIAILESNRGFGLALFDLVGGIIIIKLALILGDYLGGNIALGSSKEASQGYILIIIFAILGVLVLLASKIIYQTTLISLDAMDPFVGGILGIGSGLIVAHVILKAMSLIAHQTAFGDLLLNSFAYRQFVELRGFHTVLYNMAHFGDMPTE